MAAMLVYQENPLGVELLFYVNAFFCFNKFCIDAGHVSENTLYFLVGITVKVINNINVWNGLGPSDKGHDSDSNKSIEKQHNISVHSFFVHYFFTVVTA